MARDDVRLMARQIARGGSVESVGPPAAASEGRFVGLIKWRPYAAAALVLLAVLIGMLPVLSTSSARSEHAGLANAVQQAARAAGAAAGADDVSGWINERDLQALRSFYTEQRPRIVETLRGAGFEGIGEGDVTIRVDYGAATLVIGARVDDGDGGMLVVAADLSGTLVGRKPPPGGLGPAFDEQGGLLLSLLAGAIAICGLMWAIPTIVSRRKA